MPKRDLPKSYNPADYEDEIYRRWEKSGFFNPDQCVKAGVAGKDAPGYCIVMPPPNVTGTLHIGHAVMLAVEDILIRYHRMKGEKSLWLPGTDHAAIATQNKVEKILTGEGLARHQLGREKFLMRVNQFAKESHDTIVKQVKKIGSSCDWSREAYTLDETRSRAVRAVFKSMYDDGLIYRGQRIVNWCPRCQSTLADDEVEYRKELGKLYWLKYGPFTLATARPETKLGDTAVAVHPKDKRYQKMVGKKYKIPGALGEFEITVVADRAVDPNFGSGAIKVTPAHDFTDFDIAQRHNIPMKQVINEQGRMMDNCGQYAGLTTKEAREQIVADMQKMGLIERIEDNYEHNLALCYRCGTVIEPLPSLQWFIDVNKKISKYGKSIKQMSLAAVKQGIFGRGKIKIIPERFEKTYFYWLENLRDWCISRQIWFGHRLPVWYCGGRDKGKCLPECKQPIVSVETPMACPHCGSQDLRQDEDTLDTWFSSGLWTFSTLTKAPEEIRLENAKTKTWQLKIYGQDIFDAIASGVKKIETRAGRPRKEGEKFWGDIKSGEVIEFSLADKKTDQLVSGVAAIKKQVKKVGYFKTVDELFKIYPASVDYPGKSEKEIKQWWDKRPALARRIKKYGIWAIELENVRGRLIIDSDDFKNFHPTAVLETGYDILFFWVARMIIMTTYAIGDIPFKKVYLHGLVRDDKGRKMSKSLGNVIDPLEVAKKYGTDAVRLALVIGTSPGSDMNLSQEKIAGFRNFANKLWNVARYIIQKSKVKSQKSKLQLKSQNLTIADKWILGKLEVLIKETTDDLDNYRFSQAGEKLRSFTWDDLADWYLEISKLEADKDKILYFILENLLKLWHPFMPFVTEAIWREMGDNELLMISKWPNTTPLTPLIRGAGKQEFELVKNIIIAIRNARAVYKIEPNLKIKAVVYCGSKLAMLKSQAELIKKLRTGIDELEIKKTGYKVKQAIYLTVNGVEIYLIIPGFGFKAERDRLAGAIKAQEEKIKALTARLANKDFLSKAPEKIVKAEKEKLGSYKSELGKLKEQVESLK